MTIDILSKWTEMERSVYDGPGSLSPEQRRQAHDPEAAPDVARPLVDKLLHRPATIDDDDVRALAGAGWSEDEIFELLVSGSVYAGRVRLDAGFKAMEER